MEFTPSHSIPAIFAFLATGSATVLAAGATCVALLFRRYELARRILLGTLTALGIYAAVLLTVSLLSREKMLGAGEQKYFCEVDCHLAYSVVEVATTKTLGEPPRRKTAEGTFYLVTVNAWFDEETISSTRGDFPLRPNRRRITVVDDRGRKYGIPPAGQEALESARGKGSSLCQSLRPGESYRAQFVFDLPADASNPRLLIQTADALTRLVIGHENSLFHGKISFRLEPQPGPAREAPAGSL